MTEKKKSKHCHGNGYRKKFWFESPNVSFPVLSKVV